MALYDASGNQLTLSQVRDILAQYSSGEENPTRVYDANGEALGNGAGAPARTALDNELANAGYEGGGFRTDSGGLLIPLDDPNKVSQAQQLGALQTVGDVNVANYNDQNLRGDVGSGALFADMPQTGFVQDILTNPAFLAAAGLGAGFGSGLIGAGTEAGTVAGGGIGGGASTAYNPALIDAAYSGMGATGLGSTAAGLGTGEAGLLAAGSGLPVAGGIAGGTSALGGGFTAAQLAQAGIGGTGAVSGAGGTISGGGAAVAGAGSALSRILDGTASSADYLSTLGTLGATGLGYLGSQAQGDAYKDVANQYLALGAPARARLEASYQPGFSLSQSDPAFQNALDVAGQTSARALSTKYGNPADSPTAQAEMQKYLLGSVELPQLNTYRSQLAGQGGLGVNTAGTSSMAGAGTTGGEYNSLGYGLGQLTNPQPSYDDLLKKYGLTIGGIAQR